MGLIDALVNRSFRDTPGGRLVVFSADPRKCCHLVRSPAEEQKIRSFLGMFYFAHLSILVFGVVLRQAWSSWFSSAVFERPAHHLLGSMSFFVAIYALVVGVPYTLLWRAYRRALPNFTTPADAVSLNGTTAPAPQWVLLALIGFALLLLAVILLLVVGPRVS